ncbi:proteasome regulatory particle base subunit rpn10 [Komagataella kurtzmanii]|nr:proteasome regulatory particle base subunit rpn10 [Komagataella kurtzmanii]
MVLEATMIILDNSEFMRNGDYLPSRFSAQLDSVDFIFHGKTNSNPENTVGLMSMGGDGPQVLTTLTADFGRILAGIHDTKISKGIHFSTGIQVALLALKHRQNKVHHQRIIVFVGSPIDEDEKELEKLAKRLKKNSVAIDLINFGEHEVNTSKLERFISIVNNHDNSHLVTIPQGPKLLYESIQYSPMFAEEGSSTGFATANGEDFDFGADPNVDPELALALRLSLEEERSRQARERERQETKSTLPKLDEGDGHGDGDGDSKMQNK